MRKKPSVSQIQTQLLMYAPDKDRLKEILPNIMARKPRAESTKTRKHSEHDSQALIVKYLHQVCPKVLVSASLCGELWPMSQHVKQGVFFGWMQKLKNRGMLAGDPDLRLTWAPSRCIFLEKKRDKGGKTSEAQEAVHAILRSQGFSVYVMPGGIDEMRDIITKEEIPCLDSIGPT